MSELFRRSLLSQYQATHRGEPWYGSSRAQLLRGITAAQAAQTPMASLPSIWAVVLHMTAWTEEVHHRLEGASPATPQRGDWPSIPGAGHAPVTEAAWRSAQSLLTKAHNRLVAAIVVQPMSRFPQRVADLSHADASTSTLTVAQMLLGLVQHDAYHLGQIATLRRLVARG
jgi:uncharacterized damage-inducible protein DinB